MTYPVEDDYGDFDDGLGAAAAAQPKPPNAMQLQQMAIQEGAANLAKAQNYVIIGAVVVLAAAFSWKFLSKD